MPKEIWKPVIYRNIKPDMYEVSNLGNFRNCKTNHIMTQCPSEKGYMMVSFRCSDEKTRCIKIHRIVAWMFVPGYDELHNEVNHKDGNKKNNHADNLEWVTRKENIHHGYENGLIPVLRGERHGNHSMTDDEIAIISSLLVECRGNSNRVFVKSQNMGMAVSLHAIQRIKYKLTGKHVSDLYFDENTFTINRRIMGDDIHIICKAICEFNGNYSDIHRYLAQKEIYVTKATINCIINKRSYVMVSDIYFKKGQYKLN